MTEMEPTPAVPATCPADLDLLERLLAEADAPGPWFYSPIIQETPAQFDSRASVHDASGRNLRRASADKDTMMTPEIAALIVALRNSAPALIAAARELEHLKKALGHNAPPNRRTV